MIVIRILLITGFITLNVSSFACSCSRVGILKNKRSASHVFKGRVINVVETVLYDTVRSTGKIETYYKTQYTFKVLSNYKGLKDEKTIDLFDWSFNDCSYHFRKDKTYIVYAHFDNPQYFYAAPQFRSEPFFFTHLCSRTKKTNVFTFWESFILWLT